MLEHVMQSNLSQMHEFCMLDIRCRFVNVSLKRLKRSSQFIIHMSSFRSNIGAKQLVVNVKDSRASKSLKLVALSDSANVSIGWISSSIGGSSSIRIVFITFRMAPSLTSYSRPSARLLGAFGLLIFAMISHHWASVEWVASSFICFPLRFIEPEGLENDMSKVHMYQQSARQRLRFKVCT